MTMRRLIPFALIALTLLALLPHVFGVVRFNLLDRFENDFYDLRVRMAAVPDRDPRVVIVDIDERSLAAQGQWPWARSKVAALLDRLFDDYAVKVVGFDVVFPEPQSHQGLDVLRDLGTRFPKDAALASWSQQQRAQLDGDQRLAESLIARDVVLGFVFKTETDSGQPAAVGALPPPVAVTGASLAAVPWLAARGYSGNLQALQANATAGGFFDTAIVDADGVVRRMLLLRPFAGSLYESLALAVARVAQPGSTLRFGFRGEGSAAERLDYIELAGVRTRVDERGAALTPFRGGVGSFPYVSATDVLSGRASPDTLRDRIVLIGTSAPGLLDIRPTPVASQYIGVEAHANMIAGLLDGTARAVPPRAAAITLVTLLALALALALGVARRPPLVAISVALALLLVTGLSNAWWFERYGWVLPLATPLAYVAATALLLLTWDYFVEARRKRRLQGFFGQYVPPDVVRELDADDAQLSLRGESREMTVLFSDVRGFTTLSEKLTPRELTTMMNELLTPLTAAIQAQNGTIDKYMGDAIMAFWGAPLADPRHAQNGVLAALSMLQRLGSVREAFTARGWPPVHIGIGISTGPMNVGNMGSQFRMAYTVLGDAVNLGSRLEGLTKQYGVDILISANTAAALEGIVCREIDRVRVKGKLEPVAIFEPLGAIADLDPAVVDRKQRFEAALASYRARNFKGASAALQRLAAEPECARDEKLLRVHLQRAQHFEATAPPPDWDGVFVFESK
jgi:adenylate cyclase